MGEGTGWKRESGEARKERVEKEDCVEGDAGNEEEATNRKTKGDKKKQKNRNEKL